MRRWVAWRRIDFAWPAAGLGVGDEFFFARQTCAQFRGAVAGGEELAARQHEFAFAGVFLRAGVGSGRVRVQLEEIRLQPMQGGLVELAGQ